MKQADGNGVTNALSPTLGSRIVGTGEMADRIRSFPWQDNVLGPIDGWPAELTTMVNMVLSTEEMAAVYWGPEMILLYNDTYLPHLTDKHPALGKPFWVVWEEARAQVEELMESPYNTGRTFVTPPVPLELVRNGKVEQTYYSMTGSPIFAIRDGSSKVGGVYLTLTDQTANVGRAQQLAASEARAGRVLASIGDAVLVTDANGHITAMNGVAEDLTRWTEADALGRSASTVFSIVNETTREAVASPVAEVLSTGLPAELANHTILIGRDGTESHIDDSAAPIRNDAGEMIGVVLVFRNIEERRSLERRNADMLENLRSTHGALRLAMEFTGQGTFHYNELTQEIAVDAVVQELFEMPLASGPISYWVSKVHEDDQLRVSEAFAEAASGGKPYDLEHRIVRSDGVRWIRARATLLSSPGEPVVLTGISEDVTMQKSHEESLRQTEKLAAVGRLASTMAHEINNPLEAVTNLLYLARQSETLDEAMPLLETADAELRRAALITSQALRFHKQATRPTLASFEQLTRDLFKGRHSRLDNAGATAEKRDRASIPVLCFEGEIRQVLDNLVTNAIDALGGIGGKLLVRGRDGTDWRTGRAGMLLTFADTGSGMSASTQKKLFDAFYTTKGIGGTGLGLWVSREIIDRHSGRVLLRSREGRGTVFTIFLPYDAAIRSASGSSGSTQ